MKEHFKQTILNTCNAGMKQNYSFGGESIEISELPKKGYYSVIAFKGCNHLALAPCADIDTAVDAVYN